MNDKTRVFNRDCLEAMREFPDKYFELAIVDPPYGIRQDGHRENNRSKLAASRNYHKALWDQPRPNESYFVELFRVSKQQIIWGANNHPEHLKPSPCWIVWDKDNSGHFADCELAYASFDTAVRKFEYRWNGMLQENMKNKEERIHPTQKPVALYKWLLKNYAKEGDKILDTHGGSMSSVIACIDMGYKITCFELDEDYYNLAKLRINNYLSQIHAFRPPYEIEFHDNSGVSILRDQRTIRDPKQDNTKDSEPIYRIDGLLYGDTP